METVSYIFSVNNVLFEWLGYEMSYIEFFGTLLSLWSVYLVSKNNKLTWPVGTLGAVLFAILFYQIQLYSDLFEQFYFIITGFYGWFIWNSLNNGEKKELPITTNTKKENILAIAVIVFGTIIAGYFMSKIHIYFPTLFPIAASFAYLDAFTTVMSFVATILIAHKRIENWYIWIIVDIIGIGLYFVKGVVFISVLYMIFLVICLKGLSTWRALKTK